MIRVYSSLSSRVLSSFIAEERSMGPFEMDGAREERGGRLREPDETRVRLSPAVGVFRGFFMKAESGPRSSRHNRRRVVGGKRHNGRRKVSGAVSLRFCYTARAD